MKNLSKVILVMTLMLASVTVMFSRDARAEESGIGLSFGISYMSDYLWRGGDWYGGDGAFFPSLSYDVLGSGFTLSVSAELAEAYIFDGTDTVPGGTNVKDLQATDFGLDYSYSIGDKVTLGASIWYFLLWDTSLSFMTFSGSVALDFLPLTPTLTYTHDYYTDTGDAKDFYIQLGGSHSFDLMKDVSLGLGAVMGYYYADSVDLKGISDIDLSAELSVTKGIVTYSAGFHYVIVPSEDYYSASVTGKDDINKFYATFGVSCSI